MFKCFKILIQILQNPESIQSAITFHNGMIRFCLVRKKNDKLYDLLLCTDHIPWILSVVLPMVVHTDLGDIPVALCNETIGDEDPDHWIDHNEEKIIPRGFSSDAIINEYTVNNSEILSATITTRDRQTIFNKIESFCIPLSLSIPLWDLGRMYWNSLQQPFVLWRVTYSGSVLGYIENGNIIRLCNFWPDCNDLLENTEETIKEILPIIKNISGDKVPVVMYSPVKNFVFPDLQKHTKLNFIKTPDIKGVEPHNHEVYSIACHEDSSLNFVEFGSLQRAKKVLNSWCISWTWLRRGLYTVGVSIVLLAAIAGSLRILNGQRNQNFSTVQMQVAKLTQATMKRDSLIGVFKKSGQLSGNESAVTQLLCDLQVVSPEGLWADEIDISTDSIKQYRLEMTVFAKSSSLLGKFMNNMHSLKGVNGVRMVNSEQIETKKGEKVIRFKIECVWNRKNAFKS